MIPVYPEGSLDRSQAVQAPDSAPLKNSLNHMNTVVENFETGNIPTRLPLFYKLEDLQILSDLLKQESDRTPGADDSASCTFNSVIDRAIDKTSMQAFIEAQQKGCPLFKKKGDEFFEKGDFQKALKAWDQVLKIYPNDADIHLKLGTIGKLSSPLAQTAENLHAEYCFHYLDSFGHTELRNPVAMAIIPDDRILFISDYTGDKIHKFNTDGEYLETLAVEVKRPLGLFKDAANHIWICDFGHNRLVEIDSTGRFLNELRLKNDDANAPGSLNPAYGCIHDGRFFILLRDDTGYGYGRVIAFDRNNPQGSLVVLSQKMYLPSTIEFANGVLYVGDGYRNYLYIFDSIRQRFSGINGLYIPLYQRWVCSFMENLFVSAGDFICKISTRGKLIFAANLKNIIRNENAVPHGLAVLEENNRRFLLVVDFRLACIHRFAI